MTGPKKELMEAILTMWQQANETEESQYQRFMTTDGWIILRVKPGGIRPIVSAMNSKGENLFANLEDTE